MTTTRYNRENIFSYFIGNFRMELYYSKFFGFLMRKRIREQIKVRINSMEPKCYLEGACIKCGCSTPALQMADKQCDGLCYPAMLNKVQWAHIYKKRKLWKDPATNITWFINEKDEFEKIKL